MHPDNILVIPLKLPKFEPDSWETFWKVWNEDKKVYNRLHADSAGNDGAIPSWIGFSWKFNPLHNLTMFDINDKDYSKVFPILHQRLLESFPFEIQAIMFQSSIKPIRLHTDGNRFTDHLPYPASVRIMLYDSNDQQTFYFLNQKTHKATYLELPQGTNTFVYNNPKILHGSNYLKKEKILMHIICKNIDEPAWFKLLNESYQEFKDIFSIVEE